IWRLRSCGSAVSPRPTRRRGWRTTTCPTSTACSTVSTGPWSGDVVDVKQFKLPDVGEGLTEADIVKWHVRPGGRVEVNQTIVEIETAKAIGELPCPYEGLVAALHVEEGQTVDVGVPIISVDV